MSQKVSIRLTVSAGMHTPIIPYYLWRVTLACTAVTTRVHVEYTRAPRKFNTNGTYMYLSCIVTYQMLRKPHTDVLYSRRKRV